jgi:heme exporter protein D
MIWDSWSDFFAMGGYGLYVWGSSALVFGCMAGEAVLLKGRLRAIRRQLARVRAAKAPRARSAP